MTRFTRDVCCVRRTETFEELWGLGGLKAWGFAGSGVLARRAKYSLTGPEYN